MSLLFGSHLSLGWTEAGATAPVALGDPLLPRATGGGLRWAAANILPMDPWGLEITVVRDSSHRATERRSLARDVERSILVRLRRGAYVERTAYESLTPEQRHVVDVRAVAAVSTAPVVLSHFTALVLHGLPVMRSRLARVHATVDSSDARGRDGVTGHVFSLDPAEITRVRDVAVTTASRTVIDVAGSAPFPEGATAADAQLRARVPRGVLEAGLDLAGPRQAARRIAEVVAFAHPGAEGPNESFSRVGMLRLGIEPPELQHPLRDDLGFVAWLDFWFRRYRVGGEADGRVKFLDPAMAKEGAGMAVYREKQREDRVLPLVAGLARWGWAESSNPVLLGRRLAAFGVVPSSPPATPADYAAAARGAQPRRRLLVPR